MISTWPQSLPQNWLPPFLWLLLGALSHWAGHTTALGLSLPTFKMGITMTSGGASREPNEIDLRACFISSSVAARLEIIPAQPMVGPSDRQTCEVLSVCKKLSVLRRDPQMLPDLSLSICLQCRGEGLRLGSPPELCFLVGRANSFASTLTSLVTSWEPTLRHVSFADPGSHGPCPATHLLPRA